MFPVIHISIPSYSFFAAIGFFFILIFLYFRIEKYKLLFSDFLKLIIYCVIWGFLGSRFIAIISRIPLLISNFSLENLISTILGGGLVFYGGLFGVLFGSYRYSKKHNININNIFEFFTPAIPLFHVFGRIGCFLAGCCYGVQLKQSITIFGLLTLNRLPVQLIEASFNAILFIVLLLLKKTKPNANSFRMYMLSYATFRFIIEFWRGDDVRGLFWGISTSQLISIAIIIIYFIIILRQYHLKRASN